MRKRILLTGAFSLMMFSSVFSQVKVGDNPAVIDNNAVLEIESTNKGVLIPRMALNDAATEAPLAAPLTEGMMIYSLGGAEPNGFYYWNGTAWRPFNQTITTLVDNGDGSYTYTSEDGTQTTIIAPSVNVSSGAGAPVTAGTAGDIYTDSATGDIYTYNGTTNMWESQTENVTTLVDNGDGTFTYTSEDGTAVTFNSPTGSATTGNGAPTGTGTGGDLYVDETTGDIYTYNGTTGMWENQTENVTTLVDNGDGTFTYTSEDGTAVTFNSPTGSATTGNGAPTGTGTGGDLYVDETTGDIYTYNGTTGMWENQTESVTTLVDNGDGTFTYTSEDGTAVTFNSPTGSATTGNGVPTGTGTGGDLYVDGTTGDIYTYNGATNMWENQTESVTTLVDNGDGTFTYTSEDGTAVTFNSSGVSLTSGIGAPVAAGTAGDVYVDEATGDVYSFNGVTNQWESQLESITTMVDNMDGTYIYTSEDGTATTIDASSPGYSTTEYLTGKQWINGKDVYEVVVTRAVTGTSASISLVGSPVDNATTILDIRVVGITGGVFHSNSFDFATKNLVVGTASQGTFLVPGTYNIIVEYTK